MLKDSIMEFSKKIYSTEEMFKSILEHFENIKATSNENLNYVGNVNNEITAIANALEEQSAVSSTITNFVEDLQNSISKIYIMFNNIIESQNNLDKLIT